MYFTSLKFIEKKTLIYETTAIKAARVYYRVNYCSKLS